MAHIHLSLPQKSLLYASKTTIGALICWGALHLLGIDNPMWAMITVVLVSDPDLNTARTLVAARVVNTIVGGAIGLTALLLFDYAIWIALAAAALTILVITSIEHYPTNWRLAPVTVFILFDAARHAASPQEEIHLALLRALEIGLGSAVALALALVYTRLFRAPKSVVPTSNE